MITELDKLFYRGMRFLFDSVPHKHKNFFTNEEYEKYKGKIDLLITPYYNLKKKEIEQK